MKDKDIRIVLKNWIINLDPLSTIREEMPVGSTRFDITMFSRKSNIITGFEIKSDHDTLQRLPNQVIHYDYICDYNYIVVTKKHLKECIYQIKDYWGILLVKNDQIMVIRMACERVRGYHDKRYLLSLCWKDEILRNIDYKRKYKLDKSTVVEIAIVQLELSKIKQMVIEFADTKRI